ncbi:MAG: carboxypeptidase M32 [Anaerolineae bacterium]|jgi:carboxypeptidase Taq|nr:carboxypeptidase M32 [Anaerolineae bacterium]
MQDTIKKLKEMQAELTDIGNATAALGWDQVTYMPTGGAEDRGYALSTLSKIAHMKSTDPQIGVMLAELEPKIKELDPDCDDARWFKVTKRNYEQNTKLPVEFVIKLTMETSMAQMRWQEAREKSDFSLFRPHLENIVELMKEGAGYFAPFDHIYDPLLDMYEPGMKTADVKKIFNDLRPIQVELIKAIQDSPQVDDSFLNQTYPKQKQWDFGVELLTAIGFDFNRGRQDYSAHPFTTSFGLNDVRITTRISETDMISGMMSTLHEGGHGLYELGGDPLHARDALHGAASLAVHESQSRMWENLIGRSMPFWQQYYPRLQSFFPSQLANVSLDQWYRGINKVEPSMIRVEADEATYNLHIMLRLEIEMGLMEGKIKVAELPEYWNTKMEEYLGITPKNDAEGVLQDVHWSNGLIGYFSTYALGNLISVQLWEVMQKEMPNMNDMIAKGEFHEILGWLREKIHVHGSKYEPQELVEMVTGSKITAEPYMKYLTDKYSAIYGF